MASESVAAVRRSEWVHKGTIIMQDMLLGVGLSDSCVGQETMRKQAEDMARWAKSILTVARARGDNSDDAPGTLADALAGAEFFLHLSLELKDAAPKMKASD